MDHLYIDTGRTSSVKKHDNVIVEKSFSQMYRGIFRLFAQINSPCAKNLLIWAVTRMDRWNRVALNKSGRKSFIAETYQACDKRYADSTVKGAIVELISVGVIVSMSDDKKRESSYMINPYFYWKTKSKSDRFESIKAYINILKEHEENRI